MSVSESSLSLNVIRSASVAVTIEETELVVGVMQPHYRDHLPEQQEPLGRK